MSQPRAIQARVSKYQRNRLWSGNFVRGEAFSLSANFAGVLDTGVTIDSVIWRVNETQSVIFGNASISGPIASVQVTAGWGCGGAVKCQIIASDGSTWNQVFLVNVQTVPWYSGEQSPVQGPQTASA